MINKYKIRIDKILKIEEQKINYPYDQQFSTLN